RAIENGFGGDFLIGGAEDRARKLRPEVGHPDAARFERGELRDEILDEKDLLGDLTLASRLDSKRHVSPLERIDRLDAQLADGAIAIGMKEAPVERFDLEGERAAPRDGSRRLRHDRRIEGGLGEGAHRLLLASWRNARVRGDGAVLAAQSPGDDAAGDASSENDHADDDHRDATTRARAFRSFDAFDVLGDDPPHARVAHRAARSIDLADVRKKLAKRSDEGA